MNKLKLSLLFSTLLVASSLSTVQAADVGVSVSIGQPGFYGQLDIGSYPPPVLVYSEPVVVHRPVGVVYEPIYLHVPPGQARKWHHYCGQYNACGRPVYFVQDRWYNDVYAPRYRSEHGYGDHGSRHEHHGKGHGHGRDH